MPSALRGRAGGAWVLAIGTAPLGQLQIGVLGVSAVTGIALAALAVAGALCFPRLRRL